MTTSHSLALLVCALLATTRQTIASPYPSLLVARQGEGDSNHVRNTFDPNIIKSEFDIPNGEIAKQVTQGGGRIVTLTPDFAFAGRQMGGANRTDILGTQYYGSGYPYGGSGNGSEVTSTDDRPFPFGFWPLWWPNYGGSEEYGPWNNDKRHGDFQLVHTLRSNNPSDPVFYAIGDRYSLYSLQIIQNATCGAAFTKGSLTPFNEAALVPENVVQYFRASSYALAFPTWNQTIGTVFSTTTEGQTTFYSCLVTTTASDLPIMAPHSEDGPIQSPRSSANRLEIGLSVLLVSLITSLVTFS